jgi:hypothetical protein
MTADRPAKKDLWDRFQIAAQVVAAVFIPIALAAGSAIVSRSLQKQEHGTKMIELALDVLRSDPGTAGQQDGLRGWAVDLLAEYSDTPISDSARQRLLARPLPSFQRTVDVLSTLKGGESIEERALASGALNSIFLNAVESGNRNLVAQLLSAGLSPNTADPDGTTALTHAALVGDDNITALLLQANANPNLANKTGDTPLIIASRGGHVMVLKRLLAVRGIEINHKNFDGVSALAIAKGNKEIIDALTAAAASSNRPAVAEAVDKQ